MQAIHIELIRRETTERKTEFVGLKMTVEQLSKLDQLVTECNSDRTDVLLQLIELAHKSLK